MLLHQGVGTGGLSRVNVEGGSAAGKPNEGCKLHVDIML
jgi:hypothetical protein